MSPAAPDFQKRHIWIFSSILSVKEREYIYCTVIGSQEYVYGAFVHSSILTYTVHTVY